VGVEPATCAVHLNTTAELWRQ